MKKTRLFAMLVGMMLLAAALLFAIPASAEVFSGECGQGVSWAFDSRTGELRISGSGEMRSYSHPSSVPWNDYCEQIKTVVIEDGVQDIGQYSFFDCKALRSIRIPDSVTKIGSSAFENCYRLKNVTLPEAVTAIDSHAFRSCRALESLAIPHGVQKIEALTFEGCTSLAHISIPDSVTTIGTFAFADCESLTSLVIPNSVMFMEEGILKGCKNLETLSFPVVMRDAGYGTGNPNCFGYLFSVYGDPYQNGGAVPRSLKTVILTKAGLSHAYFYGCENIETIVLPNRVFAIPRMTFQNCTSLERIVLPTTFMNGEMSIEANAFDGCTALTQVEYHGSAEQWEIVTVDRGNDILQEKISFVSCAHAKWAKDETSHRSVCVCGAEIGDPAAHTWSESEVLLEATHLTTGEEILSCFCGQSKHGTLAALPDHIWDEGVVTVEPTKDIEGVKTFTCECGETKTEAIAKLATGCSSIVTSSFATMALITLAGGMVACKKKRK